VAASDHNKEQAQSLAVKRAEVEFHNFASLGQPERAMRVYEEENDRRLNLFLKYQSKLEPFSPFLEIGANAGHTSYLLANRFNADGFALDISADSLRHGIALMEAWNLDRAPIRLAGDALRLPFADNSLRLVCAFQMLSQFQDIEAVFLEVKRVLAPGGIFLFAEEPLRRMLTLSLWRAPYYEQMKPWERKLYDWGVLGFLVRDVIGAGQEESFGIRQNHTMTLGDWRRLLECHFTDIEYDVFLRERGPLESAVRKLAQWRDPHGSVWGAAHLLGGTLAVNARKKGEPYQPTFDQAHFESILRCPDCGSSLSRDQADTLQCACGYQAPHEGGVYNLLRTADKRELYPGDRDDILDMSLPHHETLLGEGWHKLEGIYGNKYRWIGPRATVRLYNVTPGPKRLRIRGFAPEDRLPFDLRINVNGNPVGKWKIDRPGLFVLETDVDDAPGYAVEFLANPVWSPPGDDRQLSVNLSLIRLVPGSN
jgi:ubiquinone/menaquinone biosynthesis C-methylase UbiE